MFVDEQNILFLLVVVRNQIEIVDRHHTSEANLYDICGNVYKT